MWIVVWAVLIATFLLLSYLQFSRMRNFKKSEDSNEVDAPENDLKQEGTDDGCLVEFEDQSSVSEVSHESDFIEKQHDANEEVQPTIYLDNTDLSVAEISKPVSKSLIDQCLYDTPYFARTHNDLHSVIASKGNRGEFLAYCVLSKKYDPDFIFPNVYIPFGINHTTEIDLVMVTSKAIYVLECKYYSGSIVAKSDEKYWIQRFPKSEYKFYNPLLQNRTHVKALSERLQGIPSYSFVPVVVFSDRCRFVSTMPPGVVHRKDLIPFINKTQFIRNTIFSIDDLTKIHSRLLLFCNQDESVKVEHIADVNIWKTYN